MARLTRAPDEEPPPPPKENPRFQGVTPRIVILLALLFLSGDGGRHSTDPVIKALEGRVLGSSDNNPPVVNAALRFLGRDYLTDQNGAFILETEGNLFSGALTATHPDYKTKSVRIDLSRDRSPLTVYMQKPFESSPVPTISRNELQIRVNSINEYVEALEEPRLSAGAVRYNHYRRSIQLSILGIVILLWLGLLYLRWRNKPALLHGRSAVGEEGRQPVRVARQKPDFFNSQAWRRVSRALRRHAYLPTNELDVDATATASAEMGGLLTPVFAKQAVSPEYLILVERDNHGDHRAALIDRLIGRLRDTGNYVTAYYFKENPRTLSTQLPRPRRLTLKEAALEHGYCRLIIFSDATTWPDPVTGKRRKWFDLLNAWPQRALITPRRRVDQGDLERGLRRSGFLVYSRDAVSMESLADHFDGMESRPKVDSETSVRIPELLTGDNREWLREPGPEPKRIQQLITQLSRWLDEAALYWLRASAAFPRVDLQLTLYLGNRLTLHDDKLYNEQRLARLAILPWFRHGSMPANLRRALLDGMSHEQREQVRRSLTEWLASSAEGPDSYPIDFARAPETSFLSSLKRDAKRERGRSQDPILLGTLNKELAWAMDLPPVLKRALYRGGNPLLGWRPLPLIVVAALAVFLLLKPIQPQEQPSFIPRFTLADPTGADPFLPPGLDLPYARSLEPVSYYIAILKADPNLADRVLKGNDANFLGYLQQHLENTGRLGEYRLFAGVGPAGQADEMPVYLGKVEEEAPKPGLEAGTVQTFKVGNLEMKMVWCPPDTFMMGSPEDEPERFDRETRRRVELTEGFWMAQTEVTQAQWKAVMGSLPEKLSDARFLGDDKPVIYVSWDDVQIFLNKLNEGGNSFRLLTEAEWEYACRAGITGAYAGDLDKMAWYYENSGLRLHEVARKQPNSWGLYDMHGNVWEWCADWYGSYAAGPVTDPRGPDTGEWRVLRGGSWGNDGRYVRSAYRNDAEPVIRGNNAGFRPARGL